MTKKVNFFDVMFYSTYRTEESKFSFASVEIRSSEIFYSTYSTSHCRENLFKGGEWQDR